MDQRDSKVFIAKENLQHAFGSVRALMAAASAEGRGHFSWVSTGTVLQADNLAEQLEEWRWEAEFDAQGNLVGLDFTGEKLGDDLKLFKALAPYVRPGSYIDMYGEDGAVWRWYFDGSTCHELDPEIRFNVPNQGDVIDVDAREINIQGTLTCRTSSTQQNNSNTPKSLK